MVWNGFLVSWFPEGCVSINMANEINLNRYLITSRGVALQAWVELTINPFN